MTASRKRSKPGIGWPLLPTPDADGTLGWPSLVQSVEQGVRVILATRPGEQLMRPTFGAGLEGFVHQQNTPTTRAEIRDAVRNGLRTWEPRIYVDEVDVRPSSDDQTNIRVEVFYRLKRTGESLRLGLTIETGE